MGTLDAGVKYIEHGLPAGAHIIDFFVNLSTGVSAQYSNVFTSLDCTPTQVRMEVAYSLAVEAYAYILYYIHG